MRRPLIVGAQKLYLSRLPEAVEFAKELVRKVQNKHFDFDIAICPSFINLAHVADILRWSQIEIGAQNVHQENDGAFTGQVSIKELLSEEIKVKYVMVGHSELRIQQGETNEMINAKIKTCLKHGVIPIACVGETREQRDLGRSEEVIERHIREMFKDISRDAFEDVVIAYEPVWAITGMNKDAKPATADEANDVHGFIRDMLSSMYGNDVAEKIRVVYGGSVSPTNAGDFLKKPSIDGLLVGSASRNIDSFWNILEIAQNVVSKRTLFLTGLHSQAGS